LTGIAVIGTGHWGRNHARLFGELCREGLVERVKLCDPDAAAIAKLSTELDLESIADYRRLLDDPTVQAVSIATPSRTHYRIAREFLESGRDVLVEKPMTMEVGEAEELVETASRTGRILMAGHLFRYHPAIRELKRRLESDELGTIQNLVSYRLAFGLPRKDMGVVYALGIHELDMFCYLMDADYPKSLLAVATNTYSDNIEETVAITLDFGRVTGYALESWLMPAFGKKRELAVIGSRRSARVDYLKPGQLTLFDNRIVTRDGVPTKVEDGGQTVIEIPYAEPLKEELRHFLDCVHSREAPLTDGHVGLRGVVMAEAALESVRTGEAIGFG